MKFCIKCKIDKEVDEFSKNGKNYSSICKKCRRDLNDIAYTEGKYIWKNYYLQHKKWFIDLKISLKCERCNFSHPAALDFHHLDPKDKLFSVNMGNIKPNNKDEVLEEIKKCIILCSNCHRIEHAVNLNTLV